MRIRPILGALLLAMPVPAASAAEVLELQPVLIRSTRPRLADAPQGVTVLGRDALQASGATDLARLLDRVPGFSVRRLGGLGQLSTATLRGALGEGVLVLRDGVKLNSPVSGGVDLSTVSLAGVEEVQILKGAASGLYGSEAVGGVIHLKTARTPRPRVEGGMGSWGERYVQLETGQSLEDAAYTVGLRRTTAVNDYPYFYREEDATRANSALEGLDVAIGAERRWGYDALRLALSLTNQDKGVPGPVNYPSPAARQRDLDLLGSLSWSQWHADGPHQTTSLSLRQNGLAYADPGSLFGASSETRLAGTDLQSQAEWELASHLVTLGGGVSYDALESTNLGPRARTVVSAFGHETWYATPDLSLFGDLRLDHHSSFGLSASPRLGANYRLTERQRLWASVGQAYRSPTFNDLYWPATSTAAGNPALRPERTTSAELGTEAYLLPDLLVEGALFASRGADTMMWLPDAQGVWSPENIGQTETRGVELKATYRLGEAWAFEGGGTWLEALDRSVAGAAAGKALLYRPDWLLRSEVTWRPWPPLSLAIAWDYTGRRFTTAQNTETLPPFELWSARIGYDLTAADRLLLWGENLTNTYYQLQPYYPMPGRAFLAAWAHTF